MTELSPRARLKLASLRTAADQVQRPHGLVERYATNPDARQGKALVAPLQRRIRPPGRPSRRGGRLSPNAELL